MTWHGRSTSVEHTLALGAAVGRLAQAGDLIALVGELGAGKTQFVRGLARGLGAGDAPVSSPTFVMVQEYATGEGAPALVHIDAYRLHSRQDLESIGWEFTGDRLGGEMRQGTVVAVEWADRVTELHGEDRLEVALAHEGEHERSVAVTPHGESWRERWPVLAQALNAAAATGVHDPKTTPCPTCKKPVPREADTFPFCSPRCRLIDLGKWIQGDYVISRPIEQADFDEQ